jgi:N-acetylglucosamine-6-phosphate deacetylase
VKTLIKNAHIISPDIDLDSAAVLIEDELISTVYLPGEALPLVDLNINAAGKMLVPGFIDIHFHGHSGYDFCDGSLEAISTIAQKKLEEGVTSFLLTTLTLPESQLIRALEAASDHIDNGENWAKISGIHLEGPFFNPDCVGAQNPAFLQLPDIEMVKRLNAIFPVKKVSYSIELEGAMEFTRQLTQLNIIPACAHSNAAYAELKQAWAFGLRHMTHFCNVMTPLHHLEIGLVGGGLLHKDIFIELICDGIHLCPEMIQLLFEIKSPDKIILITDAMRAAGMPDGEYDLGGIPTTVKNGCARLKSGTVAGSTLLYYKGLKNVHEITGLPLKKLIKTTALNQAHSLGLGKLGKIESGFVADLQIINRDFSPAVVFVNGERKY